MKSPNREKINPGQASKKGRHPTWNTYESSRHNWRKTFLVEGILSGKKAKQKRRRFNRETIRNSIGD